MEQKPRLQGAMRLGEKRERAKDIPQAPPPWMIPLIEKEKKKEPQQPAIELPEGPPPNWQPPKAPPGDKRGITIIDP